MLGKRSAEGEKQSKPGKTGNGHGEPQSTRGQTGSTGVQAPNRGFVRQLLWLSGVMAVVAMVTSLAGVLGMAYGPDSSNLAAQAMGQDGVNVLIAYPLLLVLMVLALRGSVRAYLLWLGMLIYSAYSYLIYATSFHFTGWFLAHVLILGLSAWLLIAGIAAIDFTRFRSAVRDGISTVLPGRLLVIAGAVFAVVWLSEIIASVLAGEQLDSAQMAGLHTNPVYVADLGLLLPALVTTGVLLLRKRVAGFLLAAPMLVYGVVFGLAVIGKFVSLAVQGEPADAVVVVLMAVVALVFGAVLFVYLRGIHRDVPLYAVLREH